MKFLDKVLELKKTHRFVTHPTMILVSGSVYKVNICFWILNVVVDFTQCKQKQHTSSYRLLQHWADKSHTLTWFYLSLGVHWPVKKVNSYLPWIIVKSPYTRSAIGFTSFIGASSEQLKAEKWMDQIRVYHDFKTV